MKKYLLFLLVVLIGVSLPLFGERFIPTHDGEYHIIRFWQFYKMLSFGYLFPRWAPDLNSGYGLPLFIFHYPFPNYIGSAFHLLGVSFVDSVKLTLAAGYITAILWCFLWLRQLFGNLHALVGAVVCAMVPYWFLDMYVRGSVGEVWALSFVLYTLFAFERNSLIAATIGIAGIILSHNITAFIFVPLLFLYSMFRKKGTIYAILGGIALSAYFWIPALFEKRFMVGLNSVSYVDHFPDIFQLIMPSWGTGFSGLGFSGDEMSFQIGVMPLLILVLCIFMALRKKEMRYQIVPVLLVTLIAIYGMTAYSQEIWRLLPILQNIQYPWRLLMIPTITVSYLAAAMSTKLSNIVIFGFIIFSCIFSFSYTRPVTYERRTDNHYLSRPNFTDGTSSLGNAFSTIYTGWKKERFIDRFETEDKALRIDIVKEAPLSYLLVTESMHESSLSAQILYFPGWKAFIDDMESPITYKEDGLIHITVPKGEHRIKIQFRKTPVRAISDYVSLLSLFSLTSLGILKVLYANRNKHKTTSGRSYGARNRGIYRKPHKSPKKGKKH